MKTILQPPAAPNQTVGLASSAVSYSVTVMACFHRIAIAVMSVPPGNKDIVSQLKQLADNGIGIMRAIQRLADDRSPCNLKKVNVQVRRHTLGVLRALDALEAIRARET